RHGVQGGKRDRLIVFSERDGKGSDSFLRLLAMHDAFNKDKARAKHIGCPVKHRIPMVRLALNQCGRIAGAVAQKIG
ncbi:hypothetical protein SB783_40645, partial [Paraburkholderia sp. SIMBA_009]